MSATKKKNEKKMNNSRFGVLRFRTVVTFLPYAGGSASFAIVREAAAFITAVILKYFSFCDDVIVLPYTRSL